MNNHPDSDHDDMANDNNKPNDKPFIFHREIVNFPMYKQDGTTEWVPHVRNEYGYIPVDALNMQYELNMQRRARAEAEAAEKAATDNNQDEE